MKENGKRIKGEVQEMRKKANGRTRWFWVPFVCVLTVAVFLFGLVAYASEPKKDRPIATIQSPISSPQKVTSGDVSIQLFCEKGSSRIEVQIKSSSKVATPHYGNKIVAEETADSLGRALNALPPNGCYQR